MSNSNNRAMLLAGLRTARQPQTAAIGGSFQPPRFASSHQQPSLFEENLDDLNPYANLSYGVPMTAALDGRAPRFQQQQQQQQQQLQFLQQQARMAAMAGPHGLMNPIDPAQAQLMQLQLMQAMVAQQQQAQKLQAELAMQQQVALALSAQRQTPTRVVSTGSRMPSTAGPTQTTFDIRSGLGQQMNGIDERSEIGAPPMTAALGGKFGSRSLPSGLNPNAPTFKLDGEAPQSNQSTTVVISGGVSLGAPSTPNPSTPSKSDSAVSWRRGSNAAATVAPRSGSPPKVLGRQSPPTAASSETVTRESPTNGHAKYRPQPLRIKENQAMLPAVLIENEQGVAVYSSGKLPSPTGSNSSGEGYRTLGKIVSNNNASSVRHSQPVRQPRGPPAGEEISALNFASRVKRAASNPMIVAPQAGFVEAY